MENVNPVNLPENNQTPPSHSKPNLLIIISLIFLIILVSAGSFVLGKYFTSWEEQPEITQTIKPNKTSTPSPSADLTTDWKTYTNNKYSFSFKYTPDSRILGDMQSTTFTMLINNNPITVLISDNALKEDTENHFLTIIGGKDHTLFKDKVIFSKIVIGNNQFVLAEQDSTYFSLQPGGFLNLIATGENYLVIFKYSKEGRQVLDQILSTFRFLEEDEILSVPTSKNIQKLNYNLPVGWETQEDETGAFEAGFDPNKQSSSLTYTKGYLSIFNKGTIGGAFFMVGLFDYDEGSKHTFIYKQMGVEPTKGDAPEKYKEEEVLYNNRSCLFLENVYYSQFPTVWGMCDAGDSKAFLITANGSFIDYQGNLQTVRLIK